MLPQSRSPQIHSWTVTERLNRRSVPVLRAFRRFPGVFLPNGLKTGGTFLWFPLADDMGKSYRFREEIALGDLAFEATGDSVSELCAAAALAVIETMVDPLSVETNWTQEVRLSQADIEDLLFEWLNAIVFIKDAEGVVFHNVRVRVNRDSEKGLWHLDGTLIGDRVEVTRQTLRTDVKAVTKHLYEVGQKDRAWFAHVVLDV